MLSIKDSQLVIDLNDEEGRSLADLVLSTVYTFSRLTPEEAKKILAIAEMVNTKQTDSLNYTLTIGGI